MKACFLYVNSLVVIRQILFTHTFRKTFKKNFMAPFYGWSSTALRLEPLPEGTLLFTTKFPEIPCTHLIDLRRMKDLVDLGATHSIQSYPLDNCIPFRITTK